MRLVSIIKNLIYLIRFYSTKPFSSINRLNKNRHQVTSTTFYNRYPEIFLAASDYLTKSFESSKILSFGCSYGHECISIVRYIPNSIVHGVDISTFNLLVAQIRNNHPHIKYYKSNINKLRENGKFNLIFALSVLCRWEDTKDKKDISDIYPFEKFDGTIAILDSILEINGLLIIYNSNFRFQDSDYFANYEPVKTPYISNSGFVTKFDKENLIIDTPYPDVIFKKIY